MFMDIEDHITEHLNETAIGVKGKPSVGCGARHSFHRDVVQAKIQNRVHHARHRKDGAGTHGQQQGVLRIPKFFACLLFNIRQSLLHLFFQAIGKMIAHFIVLPTYFGSNGHSGRNRQSDPGHLRQPGAFTAEQRLHVGTAFFEQINHFPLLFRFVHSCFPLHFNSLCLSASTRQTNFYSKQI